MPVDASPRRVWDAALGRLELQVTRPSFDTWLRGTIGIAVDEDTLVVSVPTPFAAEWLEQRMTSLVEQAIAAIDSDIHHVAFKVLAGESEPQRAAAPVSDVTEAPVETSNHSRQRFAFNPHYSFDAFVVGGSNQLAYAASMAVADTPGTAYNPLFLYGAVGLGKTHLLHAIGARASEQGKSVAYVTCEQFTNEFLAAIRERSSEQFRARYRTVDILLLDDIQFIAGKEGTQEGFFHTFNALHDSGRQVVITCDRHPSALPLLEERLRSRFEWGLTADIGSPDYETRVAMVQRFSATAPVAVPEDVVHFIAERAPANIRSLQGLVTRITAMAHFTNVPVSLALAQSSLGSAVAQDTGTSTPKSAIAAVAAHFGLPPSALVSGQRDRTTSAARQLAMYVLSRYFNVSLEEIGSVLGNRDRTTVIYNVKRITRRLQTDQAFASEAEGLLASFESRPQHS